MYDIQVVKRHDEKRRPSVVGFGGVGRPAPNTSGKLGHPAE